MWGFDFCRSMNNGIMKSFLLLLISLTVYSTVNAQVSMTALSVPYTQNFNTLRDTGLNNPYNTFPSGWYATELGTGANTLYRAAHGELAGGDIYSFGDSANAERAFGSLGSGTVAPLYLGVALVNNTTATVQRVRLSYRGELWRIGNPARSTGPDTLHFAYGKNNGSLTGSTWNAFTRLSFVSPAPAASTNNIDVNGNLSANVVNYTDTLINLNLAVGDTLWLRWMDANSSSFDDGLGIDDVSITFLPAVATSNFLMINSFNTYYRQNFDSLSKAYSPNASFSTLPKGWYAHEEGSGADNTYKAAYGEFAGGNIYSWGDSLSSERALGSIGSGSVTESEYGAAWINMTGQLVNNVEINFMGEMWRQGRPGRASGPDTLHFSYATHALNIDSGNYQIFAPLSFYAPVTTGVLSTAMNGNLPANRKLVTGTISSLNLQPGDTLWIRWRDFDSESFDDGLGIDSFSLAAVSTSSLLNMEFKQSSTTVSEDSGIVSIPVAIHNKSGFLSQVEVFIADKGTIDTLTDINLSSAYVSFPGSKPDTIAYFNFGLINSQPFEQNEYFVLGLRNAVNGRVGTIQYDTIRITNYQYPAVAIASLSSDDAQGKPDSLKRNYVIEGIVHGVNYSATGGLDFYVIQNGAGINVYQPSIGNYVPAAGDQVKVWGSVGQFRGLTRMESLDSVQKISSSNPLQTPIVVAGITEATESAYLQLDSLKLIPAISTWPVNLEVYAVSASSFDTIAIYVSGNTDLAGTPAPTGYFSITGIGSQFNSSTNPPYNNGYRLMAANKSLVYTTAVPLINNSASCSIFPNPFSNQITVSSKTPINNVAVYSIDGKLIMAEDAGRQTISIQTTDWKPGVYILQVNDGQQVIVNKIIKN